jgi:glycosyltransferase involved in cell wall biosynthesis
MVNAATTSAALIDGINVAGYLTAESGVGSSARGYVRALKRAGLNVALNNFEVAVESRKGDQTFGEFSRNNPYPINLVCVNADQVPAFVQHYGKEYFRGKYNIGVWWWELPDFPQEYWESFRWFDEIWVGSSFIQQAVSRCSPSPVVLIPPPFSTPEKLSSGREQFGLNDVEYIFLFMFDFFSGFERKNPLGVITAFRKAFTPDQSVRLVLKCINSGKAPDKLKQITDAIGDARVTLIDQYFSADETTALINECDSYVSLHRAEGLGMPLVEAMLMRKPVIATGWSGNVDFMRAGNSYPLPYTLVVNDSDSGPYRKGEVWAEPDVDAAADAMKNVVQNRQSAELKAAQGFVDAQSQFNEEVIASLINARLVATKVFHPDLRAPDDSDPRGTFLLDKTVETQLEIISSGGGTGGAKDTIKTAMRRVFMPIVERAGYLNSIYSQLFRKLFADYASFKGRIDLIDQRTRQQLSRSDARILALEEEIRRLREERST